MSEDLKNMLKPILKHIGVTRISNITGYEDKIIHVFQSVRPSGQHLIVDSGKGTDKISAFISCAVESIERYAAEFHTDKGETISYQLLPLILQNENDKLFSIEKIKAVKGQCLNNNKSIWLPKDLIDYKNKTSDVLNIKKFFCGTTGLGAHTDRELAIYSGLIEVLERDAIAENRANYILNLNSIPNDLQTYIDWINENVGKIEIRLHQSSYGVFVFSCYCINKELIGGLNSMGACVDKHSALKICLIEGIQTWLMRISASRDDWYFAKRSIYNNLSQSPHQVNYQDIDDHTATKSIYDRKINLVRSIKSAFVYDYKTKVSIDPIKVVRVIIPKTKKLEQGEMFTGIPRGSIK